MNSIEHLYRQVIMEHYKSPKNKGLVNDASYLTVHLNNPSCGDEIIVQIKIENEQIADIKHQGSGCSICCSSASVMSQTLVHQTLEQAQATLDEFYELIKGLPYNANILKGDAVVYQGVSQFPARIKCATLAWKAVEQAIKTKKED